VFSIGDFSKISGLTIKTLRFYHEKGLLAPTCVDEQSGYRYYDRSKIETARVISQLRGLDLSVDEIGEILRSAGDDADLREIIERQKTALDAKIGRYRNVVRALEQLLKQEEDARWIMSQSRFRSRRSSLDLCSSRRSA
jgi:DNA-binding transcriptional MerR regulator